MKLHHACALLLSACAQRDVAPRAASVTPAPAVGPPVRALTTPDDALAREVAALRELPLRAPLRVERVDAAEFAEHARTSPAGAATRATYVAFGFVVHEAATEPTLARAGTLGLFDFEAHTLWLRDDLGGGDRGVLVHEMVHALQAQTFGMPPTPADDDAVLAIESLYEGDATFVRELWAAREEGQPAADRANDAVMIVRTHTRESLASGLGIPESASRGPRFGETLSTYLDGMIFVASLWKAGGFARVDAAYARLPRSTEQILHPEKYVADEAPIAVEAPPVPPNTTKLAEGTLGELRTRLLLARCSKTPAVGGWGWGGDRYVVAEGAGGRLALLWSTEWDSVGDAMRFEAALRRVSDRCWPSVRGRGWWIGPGVTISRAGRHVDLARGA